VLDREKRLVGYSNVLVIGMQVKSSKTVKSSDRLLKWKFQELQLTKTEALLSSSLAPLIPWFRK